MAGSVACMKTIFITLSAALADLLRSRASLQLEIIALRQQLAMVADRDRKRHSFHQGERIFWVWLYRLSPTCLQTLVIFKPERRPPDTLVRWHRKGFRLYWTWKSRRYQGGRPAIDPNVRELIRTMSRNNIGWGAPQIHGELQMLGIQVSESTVAKYMIRPRKPPSQTWKTFLENHAVDLVSVDFFTVPTATFRIMYVFIILHHERREIVHFKSRRQLTLENLALRQQLAMLKPSVDQDRDSYPPPAYDTKKVTQFDSDTAYQPRALDGVACQQCIMSSHIRQPNGVSPA
jgi:hypothetical protein